MLALTWFKANILMGGLMSKWADKNAGYIFILPAVIIIVLFSIAPIIGTLRYAFLICS